MEIRKGTQVAAAGVATAAQLEAINAQAKAKMTAEQVYVFSLRLCDDQIDRDHERFDTAALPALAKLFIGKCGIVDHKWSAENQVARIFETQVVREEAVSYIKAWAYIRRSSHSEELIHLFHGEIDQIYADLFPVRLWHCHGILDNSVRNHLQALESFEPLAIGECQRLDRLRCWLFRCFLFE